MRIILTTAFIWVATLVHGQQDGIRATIDAQIEAFGRGDFSQAFTYASPSIQMFFGTPERFETMVRSGYPMVVGPDAVQYFELKEMRGAYWQKVLFRDGSGATHLLEYQMIQVDGEWRINGVRPVPLGPSA
ncbi:DUF4864 domain-containing protein [Cognatishimia activa]|uniref:DUF4864 domain-containing protein n=1 Tax=Cognatishimia activa TaxID=1715691 RepID=A0A0P1IRU1_9RHOB|nr:DUF4864 domain-containing protein [Cognatishimia activa]CUI61766.1 hypothetical protein TA5113_00947 [Cognatishimia activa]CUK26310.1 hypothetical protein TA5114_02119 [Cognatishimia activa]